MAYIINDCFNVGEETGVLASLIDIIISIICNHDLDGILILYRLLVTIHNRMRENGSAIGDRCKVGHNELVSKLGE
jgi:hypothetical protein